MTAIKGADVVIGVRLNSAIDSALAAGTGHKMLVESIDPQMNTTELTTNPIGGGIAMQKDSDTGSISPALPITKVVKFDDAGIALLAQMLGTETVAAWTGGSIHSIAYNSTLNSNFATIAVQPHSAGVFEYVNAVVTGVTLTANPNDYLRASYDIIATNRLIADTTNTTVTLASATEPSTYPVIVRPAHKVRINAQAGGALADGDAVAVTSAEIRIERPQETVQEIKAAAGLGAPRASDLVSASLTVTFKNFADFTYYTAQAAGTEYKADLVCTAATGNGEFHVLLPRLKIVADPQHTISNPGENPYTVVFKGLAATTNPTGMFSTYPHLKVINTAAKYLVG